MDEPFARLLGDLAGRLTGPLSFRLILQPLMAGFQAWRDGSRDARIGRPPYFWTMFSNPEGERARLVNEGLRAVMRVLVLGVVIDVAYQWMVFRWIYPVELVVVVLALAFVPYLLIRGVANRVTRRHLVRRGIRT